MTNHEDEGTLSEFADQASAADDLSGREYEEALDAGITAPEKQPRWADHGGTETLDERLAEETPDVDPDSAYGNPDGVSEEVDAREAGRLVAPDEGEREDEEKDLVASDEGYAGGDESAEESAIHVVEE
ncbi:DUF5709 domain-containing protein [Dermacoccus barathri]|uniref:DUF5709 domain-containing protein n=1 Tax=Dermacoccus barathri TaxID=322601 RepID=UPI00187AA879|nr:DUF5709 domain-containing protein [Dermacoccus barathri]MBE7371768.1 hypothetical protein [Dermacoccus barathri]